MAEFEKKNEATSQTHTTSIQEMISPFREDLQVFKQKMEEAYGKETSDRLALKEEIKVLTQLNQKVEVEADKLSRAIKGETFNKGTWGEFVLETILEQSGLREGEEYTLRRRRLAVAGSEDPKHAFQFSGARNRYK